MAGIEQDIQDSVRLQQLPPLIYELLNSEQRLEFIMWYAETEDGKELFRINANVILDLITNYADNEPTDAILKESLVEKFESYLQQKWSLDGKQPPQPDSYFLFHKRFLESEFTEISLTIPHTGMVMNVFNMQELTELYTQGLPAIITAIGSKELHFHELGRIRVGLHNSWAISTEENYRYIGSAIEEFTKLSTTEVWFRRAKNGTPQYIFCPAVSASLPLLSLPLSQPGQPKVLVEFSRLEAMPALLPEMFRAEHKDDFYKWLLTTNKLSIEDEDPNSLKFAPLLFRLCSNDFHISDPKIPEIIDLYKEYVKDRWSIPGKEPPFPSSVYLFESGIEFTNIFWIKLPQELMQQANSLILSTTELNQLASSNSLLVCLSIDSSCMKYLTVPANLEIIGTTCGLSFSFKTFRDIFRGMKTEKTDEHLELWIFRTTTAVNFLIRLENKM